MDGSAGTVKRYRGKLPLSSTKEFAQQAIPFSYKLKGLNPKSIRLRLAFKPFHFVFDPELTSMILKDNERFKKSFVYDYLAMVLGNGLLTAEGEEWKSNRRKMQPIFSPKGIESLFDSMNKKIKSEINLLEDQTDIYCLDYMRNMAAKVVIYSLFSEEKNANDLSDMINNLVNYANYRLKNPFSAPAWVPTSRNLRFKKELCRLQEFIQNIINQRKNASERTEDFLTYLMEVEGEDGPYFTNQQLKDELITLYIAGQETTASVLTFGIYELSKNPEVLRKMKAEIDSIDELTLSSLSSLKYTGMVIDESMRKYPPGWGVSREAVVDIKDQGLDIRKGENIMLPVYLLHHDPEIWPDPEAFKPERFETKPDEHFYMPFGTGARVCIGKYFALMEMKIIYYYLFKRFDLQVQSDYEMKLRTPMTLCPVSDFSMNLKEATN